eukprot:TRINITY_DN13817_c0_g1_i5.p1 TRINITY_DN13817_c0_g1~~TRINITY_DN13817_c0_g1_i5.p1  ORF type:complete len:251 (+),score=25.71 TRINITY_DN13817_c0_g1_i5:242-994(+)
MVVPFTMASAEDDSGGAREKPENPEDLVAFLREFQLTKPKSDIQRVAINFSTNNSSTDHELNCKSALENGADACMSYNASSFDAGFLERNKWALGQQEGPIPPVWRPYFVYKSLLDSDTSVEFLSDLQPLFNLTNKQDVVLFSTNDTEKMWSKADTFVIINCQHSECTDTLQASASLILFRRSMTCVAFASTWMSYSKDRRLSSDGPSAMPTASDSAELKQHRKDQSVLSVLAKRWKLKFYNCKMGTQLH